MQPRTHIFERKTCGRTRGRGRPAKLQPAQPR
ncbi:TPA: hypothetical protein EYP27_06695 [Candidatus Bathyarchaeota archaeon]|nr:hypothetical protein [Candidatus Bathyarchaeota archaeon]